MIMKDGKAWGVTYADGQCTVYGWVDPCEADIHDPIFLEDPTWATYQGSPYVKELAQGQIVPVKRTTTVEIQGGS